MRLRVLLGVFILLVCSACGAQRRVHGASEAPAMTPRIVSSRLVEVPQQPDVAGPYGLELKADRAVGRMGSTIATLRKQLDAAQRSRDAVRVNCIRDKLLRAEKLERDAGERRSALRAAMLDDDDKASSELRTLEALERDSHGMLRESGQCAGGELVMTQALASAPASRSTFGSLFRSTSKGRRESAAQTRARQAMSGDTMLAGLVTDHDGIPDVADSDLGTATGASTSSGGASTTARPPAPSSARHDPSMLIRTAMLTLAVYEVDKNIDAVEAAAAQAGGYLAMRGDRQIVVRVPRDRFDDALKRIEKLGDVLHRNVSAEDVTDQYVDLEMRLRNAQAVRARLEALLANATVHDAVDIHKELAKVTEEIERIEGKLKLLRDRIGWSTLTVTFEKLQQQKVRQQALLPFPWMNIIGLSPLLSVPR